MRVFEFLYGDIPQLTAEDIVAHLKVSQLKELFGLLFGCNVTGA